LQTGRIHNGFRTKLGSWPPAARIDVEKSYGQKAALAASAAR